MTGQVRRHLRSKVRRPQLHEASIHRERLTDRLRDSDARVWLISAPAGYGKTTVVLEAIEQAEEKVGWVSLDRADNDAARFWPQVAAAVLADDGTLSAILDGFDPDRIDSFVDQIMSEVEESGVPAILVLDDLHEIVDRGILDSLSRIVNHPPANLTIVLATRVDPALPIGRLRAHGQLVEIRASDLAFTAAEASQLFSGNLDEAAISGIVATTEGWATALGMLAMSGGSDHSAPDLLQAAADGQSDLADFLAGEVLNRLPDNIQRFLIETSLLDLLVPDLCDTVMDEPGSLATLRELARGRVFTQLVDSDTNTFRYHALFRDFLRTRAQELPKPRLQSIHGRAAQWFSDRGEPTPTIRHALAADDRDLALATIKQHYLPHSQAGLLATVDGWLTAFGRDECRLDARLRMAAAWAVLNARRYDELDHWLDPPPGHVDETAVLVEIHTIRSHRARHVGDLPAALAEADLAAEILDEQFGITSVVHTVQGMARVLAGRDATDVLTAAISTGRRYDLESSVVIGYSYLALAASRDPARSEEAESLADQALSFVITPVLERFHQPAAALLAKSRVALSRGRLADAEEMAEQAASIAEAGLEPLLGALIHCQQARIAHQRGAADQVRTFLRQAGSAAGERSGDWIQDEIRRTSNDTRFAAVDRDVVLLGAVELTDKEREVLVLLPHRLPRKELATQLFMSENTLKTHLTSIRHKLALERGGDLVERARSLGLIPTETDQG